MKHELCPVCSGYGDNGPHFPCTGCLEGGYYLSPDDNHLSPYPRPGYSGPQSGKTGERSVNAGRLSGPHVPRVKGG